MGLVFQIRNYVNPTLTGHVVPCMLIANFAIFDRNRRLSWKRYEIGPWLLWNVNRKSQLADRYMTLSHPYPRFQSLCILTSWISQNGAS